MRQFPEIGESFRGFIEKQKIFFVGTAGTDSDLSPQRRGGREEGVLRRDFLSLRRKVAKLRGDR